jgi:hypothetical protein
VYDLRESFQRDVAPQERGVAVDVHGHWERAERKLQASKMESAFPV